MKVKDPRKQQLIYQATLRLVEKLGLAALTMAAVGKEAGLGMGTVYTYFDSKEALVNSLYRQIKQEDGERILQGINPAEPFAVILKRVWINYMKERLEFYREHFFIDQCMNSPFLDQDSLQAGEAVYQSFYAILDLGKQQLLVKDLDNEVLTAHLVGSVIPAP